MDFTIVTASYNYGSFIAECLESVRDQRGVTLEHLVMDAGSKDQTAKTVAQFPHASFYQEPDKGMTDGINKGFGRAKGKWVMWLNADDRLKPGALLKIKAFGQKHPGADVIYGGWDYIDGSGSFLRRMAALPFDLGILVQQGCYIGSTSCFFRHATTLAAGFFLDDRFGYCMDGEYYTRLAHAGNASYPYLKLWPTSAYTTRVSARKALEKQTWQTSSGCSGNWPNPERSAASMASSPSKMKT